jgi:hypothetical protein
MSRQLRESTLIVLVAAVVLAIIFLLKPLQVNVGKVEIKKISNPILPKMETDAARDIHDIDKIKAGRKSAAEPAGSLQSVYRDYSEADAGDNMPEKWAKVSAEDKAKLRTGIDQQIQKCAGELKISPEDKKAKTLLKISTMMKKLEANNFNYSSMD